MKVARMLTPFIATFCGFLGGSLVTLIRPVAVASADNIVKASRLELVDDAGRIRATLGFGGAGHQPLLTFFSESGKDMTSVGLSDDLPVLRFRGTDGKTRAIFRLTASERPQLAMGDDRWEGRVMLGAIEGDYLPSQDRADWALKFSRPEVPHVMAGIGLLHDSGSSYSGMITVLDGKGHSFRFPQ
jgi:hypothetical protein